MWFKNFNSKKVPSPLLPQIQHLLCAIVSNIIQQNLSKIKPKHINHLLSVGTGSQLDTNATSTFQLLSAWLAARQTGPLPSLLYSNNLNTSWEAAAWSSDTLFFSPGLLLKWIWKLLTKCKTSMSLVCIGLSVCNAVLQSDKVNCCGIGAELFSARVPVVL